MIFSLCFLRRRLSRPGYCFCDLIVVEIVVLPAGKNAPTHVDDRLDHRGAPLCGRYSLGFVLVGANDSAGPSRRLNLVVEVMRLRSLGQINLRTRNCVPLRCGRRAGSRRAGIKPLDHVARLLIDR